MPSRSRDTYFNPSWQKAEFYPEYSPWVMPVEGDKKMATCRVCKRPFALSNMGLKALKSHHNGPTHKQRLAALLEKPSILTQLGVAAPQAAATVPAGGGVGAAVDTGGAAVGTGGAGTVATATTSAVATVCKHSLGTLQTMKSKEYTSRPEIPVSYKQSKPLDARKEEVAAIRSKFPNKIPLVIERHSKEKYLQALDKAKFLVPQEITLSAFVSVIRNRMTLKKSDALYILVENRNLVSNSLTMGELYRDYRDEDGFLYATYASQEAFG